MDRPPRDLSWRERIVNRWYNVRFKYEKEWERLMIRECGLNSVVQCSYDKVHFKIINPLIFLPSHNAECNYVIRVKNWGDEIPPVTVTVKSEPIVYCCLCQYYGLPYGTVEVEREKRDYEYKMYAIQLDKGTFITQTKASVDIPCKGTHMYQRINKRTAQWHKMLFEQNTRMDRFHIRNLCRRDHGMDEEVYKLWCPKCSGHKGGVPGVRVCDCLDAREYPRYPLPEHDPDQLIMHWEPFGRLRI